MTPDLRVSAVLLLGVATLAIPRTATAQTGPIVTSFGPAAPIPDPEFVTPLDHEYKLLFEVATAGVVPGMPNPRFGGVARFLNAHAQAGVPRENIKAAVVVHEAATEAAMSNEAYRARYGIDNPDAAHLTALMKAGVPVILCGQAAAAYNVARDAVLDGVQVALSTFTVVSIYGADGYQIIGWNQRFT